MTRYLIAMDLDETMIRTIEGGKSTTQSNADLVLKNENMAIYFRPYLLEFLYQFLPSSKQTEKTGQPQLNNFEIVLFTKGTEDYANCIIEDILMKLKDKFQLSKQQVDSLFKTKLYREDLNSNYKDLALIAKRAKVNVDNILLVDDLITNFKHQPNQGIKILKYAYIRPKDNELQKLMLYLKTLDTSGKMTLKEQNIFRYEDNLYT